MLRVGNRIYRRALTNVPSWNEVWELFLSEDDAYEFKVQEAEQVADWIREHQNMTPEESVENDYEVQYEEMVKYLLPDLNGNDCYRAIGIDESQCTPEEAASIDPLGIYWSEHTEGADLYWNRDHKGCAFVYRARIDAAHINVLETLTVRLHNPDEYEVRFNEGAKLYVYDCTLEHDGRWGSGKAQTVSIEDYRLC